MAINPVANSSAAGSLTGQLGPSSLGKEEFLKLLVAQLGNQDPLNPIDDKEFVAQLAQFSNLEQAIEANEHLAILEITQSAIINAQVSGLIGKEIVFQGDQLELTGNGPAPDLAFDLQTDATDVAVRVYDSEGVLVRTIDVGDLGQGPHTLAWNGLSDDGDPLAPGTYRIEVDARDTEGNIVTAGSRMRGIVTGVTFENGYPELLVGDLRTRPAEVLEVHETANPTPPAPQTP